MRKMKLTFYFLLWPILFFGQIQLDEIDGFKSLIGVAGVQALYTDQKESFKDIQRKKFSENYNLADFPKDGKVLWLKFKLIKRDNLKQNYFLYSSMPYFSVFQKTDNHWNQTNNGYLAPLKDRGNTQAHRFLPLEIKSSGEKVIYVRLDSKNNSQAQGHVRIANETAYYQTLKNQTDYNQPTSVFSLIYFAGLSMVFIFIMMMYLLVREPLYFYYMLYVFFQILYSLFSYPDHPLHFINVSWYYPQLSAVLSEPLQFIFIGFYIFFIYNLLEINKESLLGRILRSFGWVCFAYAFVVLILYSLIGSPELHRSIFMVNRGIVLPLNLILIIWILIKIKHPLITYFLVAHLLFYIGAIIAVFVSVNDLFADPDSMFHFRNSPAIIFQAGLMGEVICFSFALSKRVQLIQKEKHHGFQAYIDQLEETERIQQQMNKELDRKVDEKTEELLGVYLTMERQRENELKMEFTQKLNEMETMALRSQMNPHFLFNSMNAIKHLIMTGRSNDAMYYLDNFSYLLRKVLQNSKRKTISVEEELEVLKLYLSMEKARLGEDFNFEISADDTEKLAMYNIPGLLLQPVVENAIWHGLIPSSKKEKKLWINFEIQDTLVISIRDNGIGRQKKDDNTREHLELHQSLGMKIIHNRIELFNHAHDLKMKLTIDDLQENGLPSGTLVTFTYLDNSL